MKKIKKMLNKLTISLNELIKFDFVTGIYELLGICFNSTTKIGKKIHTKKHERVIKVLKKKYKNDIDYLNETYTKTKNIKLLSSNNIFVMWYQGYNNSPLIVQRCIDSIKDSFEDYNVIILTKDNINNYCTLSENIYNLVEKKIISLTHFSDLVRFNVLYENGGFWIDATCYCKQKVDITDFDFYTIKHNCFKEWHVSKGMWSGFFIYSKKSNPLLKWYNDFFDMYWKNKKVLPCYLFIDCVMRIAYETNSDIKRIVDSIPINNDRVFELEKHLNDDINNIDLTKISNSSLVFKLNYKKIYTSASNSLYQSILKGYKL